MTTQLLNIKFHHWHQWLHEKHPCLKMKVGFRSNAIEEPFWFNEQLLKQTFFSFHFNNLKPGIHYYTTQFLPPIFHRFTVWRSWCLLPKVKVSLQIWVDRSDRKSRSVWWSQTDLLASDSDSIQSEDIKHVWHFQPILEYILFTFVMLLL